MRSAIIGCIVCLLALPFLLACESISGGATTSPTARVANTTPIAATKIVSPTPPAATPVMLGVLGGRSMLRIGQTVRFPDQGILIRFVGVTSDTRCPISNVYCASPGEATVAFEMTNGWKTQTFTLYMPDRVADTSWNGDYPRARTSLNGYIIQIITMNLKPGGGSDVVLSTPIPTLTPFPTFATIQVTALP